VHRLSLRAPIEEAKRYNGGSNKIRFRQLYEIIEKLEK
jgi:hypothetical protein